MSDINLVIRYENGNVKQVSKEAESELGKAGGKAGKKFSKGFKKESDGLLSQIASFRTAILGVGSLTIFKSVQAAIEQENAVNRLAGALRTTGEFSQSSLQDLTDFAAELQTLTKIGDEVAISQLAIAKGFGASNEQAKQLIAVAADLSVGIGVSFESAVRLASKTLGGYGGELSEVLPELKALTQEQLRSGAAIDLIGRKYKGLSQNELNTFSGALEQSGNAFGDLLEEVGSFITQNPIFLDILKQSTKGLQDFADGLKGIRELTGLTKEPVGELGKLDKAIAKNVDKQQLLMKTLADLKDGNFFGFISAGDKADIAAIGPRIQDLEKTIASQIEKRKELVEIQRQNAENRNKETNSLDKQLTALQLFSAAKIENEKVILEQEKLRFEALEELRARDIISLQEYNDSKTLIEQETAEKIGAIRRRERDRAVEFNRDIAGATFNALKDIRVSTVELGKNLTNLAVKGFGNAAKSIGAALASGQSANQAFVDSVKATASESAGAIGDYYILEGAGRIAKSYGADATGYKMLGIGGALKVLSGALGGGGSSASSSGGGSSSGGSIPSTSFEPSSDTIEEGFATEAAVSQEPQTIVNVTVEGNSFGNEEFTRQIVESIGDEGGKQGLVFNNFQTA